MNENNISSTAEIWADSARPDQIQSLCESKEINGVQYHGFNVLPAKKDVIAGIDAVKSRRLHISSDSPRIITEIKGYKYKENKDGVVLEEPVKFRDDAMDSIRYCIFSGDWIEGDIITENRPHMKNAPVEVYQINTNAPSKVYQI
jgi:phage terminase large subunit